MANSGARRTSRRQGLTWKLLASAAVLCATTACTKTDKASERYASPEVNITGKPRQAIAKPTNPLHVATTYWAKEHQKDPRNPKAALSYARNLKALGATAKAIQVLDQTYRLDPKNTDIAAEYGRMALAANNVPLADRLLKQAEQVRGGGDWRVLSARGTVLAKKGEHKAAQGYFHAALRKKPDALSVRNNLALSYAMSGQPQQAEQLLRQAVKTGRETPRIRQNLALVMGLQGKYDEAKQLASVDIADREASANMTYLKNMVHPAKVAAKVPNQPAVPAPIPAKAAAAKRPAPIPAKATAPRGSAGAPGAPVILTGGGKPAPEAQSAAAPQSAAATQADSGWTATIVPAQPAPSARPTR